MKRLSFSIILILLIIAASDMPQAKVTGKCDNCHTMHNSMGGIPMAYDFSGSTFALTETPKAALLIYSCVGCHTNIDSDATIYNDAPIVFNTGSPTNPLAGGNFYYVVNAGDDKGHNVVGIGINDSDETLGNTPPGGTILSSQLTCAGEYGCHGDRTPGNDELAGISGGHHADDAAPLTGGTSVGKSYRFLKGILGKEDTDWEQDDDPASHNEYKGPTSPPSSSDTTTISSLCSQCHGNFHVQSTSGVGTASPWLRHPTDKVLNSSGEYAGYTTYNMLAPVARPDPDHAELVTTGVTPGEDIIMCLSCHRAHASPNYKMIRWDYTNGTLTTALEGCGVCHTEKY